jgi:hypothetical protein
METETMAPGDEVETMADAVKVFNRVGYRRAKTWRVYRNAAGVDLAMNELEFTCFNEFEAVAVARRLQDEKGA